MNRASSRLLCVAAVAIGCVAVAACSSPQKSPPPRPTGTIAVYNTTNRCLGKGRTIAVIIDGERRGAVEPGSVARYRVWVGEHKFSTRDHGQPVTVGANATSSRAVGCGAVETVGGAGGATVRLSVKAHACKAGPHGIVHWKLDGRALARQAPGGLQRVVRIPPGTHRLEAVLDGKVLTKAQITATPDKGAGLSVGCTSAGQAAGRLLPLTVWYTPGDGCSTSLSVRFAGKDVVIKPQAAYTVYVPAGRHVVALAEGKHDIVTLKTAGTVLRRAKCLRSTGQTSQPPAAQGQGKTP